MLSGVPCVLVVVCRVLLLVRCSLFAVVCCSVLFVVCCLTVVWYLLFGAPGCSLFVMVWLFVCLWV